MKIIDFWRSEGERWVSETGFNKEGFLKALSEKVPDWKEQIHDKAIWSDLHMQSNDLHEVEITKIMIEELGTEYACYLIETKTEPQYHLGRMAAIDAHHASPMMATIAALREKYDLHMTVERFVSIEENDADERFFRK